jgi:hypothetical protein
VERFAFVAFAERDSPPRPQSGAVDARDFYFTTSAPTLQIGGVLVAGATAATHRADQLAVFDKGKSAGTRDQAGSSVPV